MFAFNCFHISILADEAISAWGLATNGIRGGISIIKRSGYSSPTCMFYIQIVGTNTNTISVYAPGSSRAFAVKLFDSKGRQILPIRNAPASGKSLLSNVSAKGMNRSWLLASEKPAQLAHLNLEDLFDLKKEERYRIEAELRVYRDTGKRYLEHTYLPQITSWLVP